MVKIYGLVLIVHYVLVQSKFISRFLLSLPELCYCLRGFAWTSEVLVRNNNAHPWVECSNRGTCDRDTG